MAVGNLIRENRIFQIKSTMQTGRAEGMQTMDDALTKLMQDGQISIELGKSMMSKGISTQASSQMQQGGTQQPGARPQGIPGSPGAGAGGPSLSPAFQNLGKKSG
jgi:hypothetical protein